MEQCKIIGFTGLKKWLRHKYPMISIDRVVDYEAGSYLKSIIAASATPECVSHYPERATLPGSRLLQAFSQSAFVLYQISTSELKDDELLLMGSAKIRFHKVIVPGDQVLFTVICEKLRDKLMHCSCKATVSGVLVASFRSTIVKNKIDDLKTDVW